MSIEGVAPPGGYINDEVSRDVSTQYSHINADLSPTFKLSLPHTVKPTRNMRVVILRWGMTDCLLYTDGKTFWVEADRRRALPEQRVRALHSTREDVGFLQIMLLGYAILLDAIEINNGDMALASLHIGRQMDAIVRMLARLQR